MPIQSSRGALAAKGMGFNVDFGTSEWLWTYRTNPGPSSGVDPAFRSILVFNDSVTKDTYITFGTPLSWNTAFWSNFKSVKINKQNQISDPSSQSSYPPILSPTNIQKSIGTGNTSSIYVAGTVYFNVGGTDNQQRAGIITMNSSGLPTSSYVSGYTHTGSYAVPMDIEFVSGTPTVFYLNRDSTTTPVRNIFGSVNSSGTIGFSKYLQTSGGVTVQIMDIQYNPTDGFVYIAGWDGTNAAVLAKYNTSGTLQWQRKTTAPTNINGNGMKIGFSGSSIILACGTSASTMVVISYSNAGTINSAKTFSISGQTGLTPISIEQLSSGNIVIKENLLNTPYSTLILNKSLNVVMSKTVTISGATNSQPGNVFIDEYDHIYLTGFTRVGSAAPYDVTQYVIKEKIYSKKNRTYTVGATTIAISTPTVTETTITATDAAGTNVETSVAVSSSAGTWTAVSDTASYTTFAVT